MTLENRAANLRAQVARRPEIGFWMSRPRRQFTSALPAARLALLALASLPIGLPLAGAQETDPSPTPAVQAIATRGTWAALAVNDGRVVVLDVSEGRRFEWPAPGTEITALAIALEEPAGSPGDVASGAEPGETAESAPAAPVILIAAPGERRRTSDLYALAGETGEEIARGSIPGRAVFLLCGPGGRAAYALARPVPRSGRAAEEEAAEWSLIAADLARGGITSSDVGRGVLAAAISPKGDRIYVAMEDQIRSYSTRPLRSSWIVRSPGRNRAILPFLDDRFLVLREAQIARFDPSSLPGRDPATGLLPNDDAVSAIDLPFPGHSLAVSFDGDEMAVLGEEGRRLALVDLKAQRTRQASDLPGAATAAIFDPIRSSLYLFSAEGGLSEMMYEKAHTDAQAPEPPPVARTVAEAPPAQEGESRAATVVEPGTEREPGQPADSPEPAGAGDAARRPSSEKALRPPAATEPAPLPPAVRQAEPSAGPPRPEGLSGTITGDLSVLEAVVIYGPDSIFREHGRVRPSADGTFSVPLPPEGRYRLLLVGTGGAQLRCMPPFRQILVESEPIDGLDFRLDGVIHGRLKP